jgi:hypothetical protein
VITEAQGAVGVVMNPFPIPAERSSREVALQAETEIWALAHHVPLIAGDRRYIAPAAHYYLPRLTYPIGISKRR